MCIKDPEQTQRFCSDVCCSDASCGDAAFFGCRPRATGESWALRCEPVTDDPHRGGSSCSRRPVPSQRPRVVRRAQQGHGADLPALSPPRGRRWEDLVRPAPSPAGERGSQDGQSAEATSLPPRRAGPREPRGARRGRRDPLLGITIADRFVIVGKLGAGSMGTVYRARQEAMGRDVAIKILRSDRAFDAQAKARFTREARAMSLPGRRTRSPCSISARSWTTRRTPPSAAVAPQSRARPWRGRRRAAAPSTSRWSCSRASRSVSGSSACGGCAWATPPASRGTRSCRWPRRTTRGSSTGTSSRTTCSWRGPPRASTEEICKVLDFGIAKVMTGTERPVDALEDPGEAPSSGRRGTCRRSRRRAGRSMRGATCIRSASCSIRCWSGGRRSSTTMRSS